MADIGTLTKVIAGPGDVKFNGTSVGHTQGDVTVTYSRGSRPRNVNQYGNAPVGEVFVGSELTVAFQMAETTLTNLGNILANSPYFGDEAVGADLSSGAPTLRVEKIGDATKYVHLFKAVAQGDLTIAWDNGEADRGFNVTFKAILDPDKGTNGALGYANFAA